MRKALSPLEQQIITDIQQNGPLPFIDFMEYCLYAPAYGYYDSGREIFGAGGDFVTAPEIAGDQRRSLFAGALANTVFEHTHTFSEYDLLEVGAGSGKLAEDILSYLSDLDHLPKNYRILERSKSLQKRQQKRLEHLNLSVTIEWLQQPPEQAWQGMIIANEVLDALPVERFHLDNSNLYRMGVDCRNNKLVECHLPADPALTKRVQQLQHSLQQAHDIQWPLPYASELCPDLGSLITDLTKNLKQGSAVFIDYGYLQHEYYHPQRHMGTLVTHTQHKGHFDYLANPGESDLSAFVDFSAVINCAVDQGLEVYSYASQGNFLIDNKIDQVYTAAIKNASQKQTVELTHELQQLVLPDKMGEKFKTVVFRCQRSTQK